MDGDEAAHVEEVRLWASLRGQALARTVRGLSQYEDALLLQARLEAPEATEEARLALVRRKARVWLRVNTVATKKGDAKADDVETLLARFPCLRVAYLEVVKDRRAAPNGAEEEAEVTTRYSSLSIRKSILRRWKSCRGWRCRATRSSARGSPRTRTSGWRSRRASA